VGQATEKSSVLVLDLNEQRAVAISASSEILFKTAGGETENEREANDVVDRIWYRKIEYGIEDKCR